MADGIVQIAPDSTGKKVDVSELTVGVNIVERQRVNIADSTDPLGLAPVTNEPVPNPDSAYALLVRTIQEDNAYTQELLGQIANSLAIAATPLSAAGPARGFSVVSPAYTNVYANVSISQVGNTSVSASNGAPSFAVAAIPVVLNQSFPMPGIPQHIYGGITV